MNLKVIEYYFTPNRILDIGANVGQFRMECQRAFPRSHIFSVEANKDHEARLRSLTNDYAILLLGNEDKIVPFFRNKTDWVGSGNSIYRELTPHFRDENLLVTQEHMVRLDDQRELALTPFDLIKIDTQGSEVDIIKGGLCTCEKAKGLLLEVSLVPYNAGAPLYNEVLRFVAGIGFSPAVILDEHAETHQKDVLFLNSTIFGKRLEL